MITEWIISVFATVIAWLLGTLPVVPVPDAVSPGGVVVTQITSWGTFAARMGAWFAWGPLLAAMTFVLACVAAALVIKIVRIAASFATAGGGSAA